MDACGQENVSGWLLTSSGFALLAVPVVHICHESWSTQAHPRVPMWVSDHSMCELCWEPPKSCRSVARARVLEGSGLLDM